MGMFDTIRCGYDLGAGFYNRDLQTKDLECFMGEYWLTPSGQLFFYFVHHTILKQNLKYSWSGT